MRRIYIAISLILFSCSIWAQEYRRMIASGTYTVQEIQAEAEAHFNEVGTERGKGYKPYKRWEYNALRNMDENGYLKSPSFYFNELERYNNYVNQNTDILQRTTTGTWEELGPTYWNRTSGWNPGVGRITAIAIDHNDANTIIIGANTGGVWKTTDGGTNWTVLTDNLSNLNVYSLTIDPNNSSNYFWGSTNGNIFHSTDAGITWNLLADISGGSINKILIDPTDSSKMFCSLQVGGIYKSTDTGQNWTKINNLSTSGYDIEFKPGDTNVVYATGNQFFKSTDGGQTFTVSGGIESMDQEYITGETNWIISGGNQDNSVSPKTGSSMALFYLGSYTSSVTNLSVPSLDLSGATNPKLNFSYTQVNWSGDQDELKILYKNSAEGTWVELANYTQEVTSWADITLDLPNQSGDYHIAFQGITNYGRGVTLDDISITDDNSNTYFEEGFETNSNAFGSGPKMMGVSENDSNVVYILEANGGIFGGFYKSTDAGETFTKLNHDGKNYFGYSSTANDDSGQAPRDMDITVNPNNVNEVHIAGVLSWMSTNGGTDFTITSQWTPQDANLENIGYCHADIDILEYINGKLYVGSDGGIFVANNPSTVDSDYYTDLTAGLGIRQFYKIGISQTASTIVTGGSQDNGTSVMDDEGNWTDWLGADGMETFVDKNNSNILYGTSQNGSLYKSYNSGASYSGISRPEGKTGNWVTPFEQDPIDQNVIYSGYDQVYKSENGGSTWTAISQVFSGNLNHLKIAASDNSIMYAARGNNLYKKPSSGITWEQLNGFSGIINSIAIHPTNPDKVAIATSSNEKVYVSIDGGQNWTSYRYNLPNFNALALAWQGNAEDGLYVGMNYGVYYIDNDTENNWIPFSNNLPNVEISELEINFVSNELFASTYGRGLWKSNLYEAGLNVDKYELNNIAVYPNPASNELNISWNKGDEVTIKLFNTNGSLVYYQKNKSLIEPYKINTSQLSTGLYYLKINTRNAVITKKVIIK